MPNWCSNVLVVNGKDKEIEKFKKDAKGKDRYGRETVLNEEVFFPYPQEFKDLDLKAEEWRKKADDYAKSLGLDRFWCGDKMKKEDRDKFIKENGEEPKDGFNQGGYGWCVANWGTKWGFCDAEISHEEKGVLTYFFTSAWSPPVGLVAKMGEKYPNLRFELDYDEPGCAFKGKFVMEGGELIVDETFDLVSCPSCWNDIEECDCSQVMIKKAMDKDEWDDKAQKEMIESKEFKEKHEGSPDDEPENY